MLTTMNLKIAPDNQVESKWVSINIFDKFDLTPGYG